MEGVPIITDTNQFFNQIEKKSLTKPQDKYIKINDI